MPRRVLHDEYFNKAKAEGYLARSAYKLQQINEARRIIKPGDRILDLGCAPGAWLQVAAEITGPKGVVVGIDLQQCRHPFASNIHHLVADIYKVDPDDLTRLAGGLFDVVVSDMAPNTSGHGDAERSAALCQRVLDLLPSLLKPGGHSAMKILEGGGHLETLSMARALFAECKGFKPKASRAVSSEIYIVGKGYAPPPARG
ncbi:MAG: SAM-dependent methyltransferase [Phycisphaerales bacterium]